MPKNRKNVCIYPVSSLQTSITSHFKLQRKDTMPIQSAAKVPRLGTIGKNHIQSSFIFCIKLFSFSALNLILSLRIIAYLYPQVYNKYILRYTY